MKDIDINLVTENLKQMINVLEFDSSRSAGKAKMNSQHLHSMHWLLQNVYEKPMAKKPGPQKKDN